MHESERDTICGKTNSEIGERLEPEWKTNWPHNGDLRTWFRCMLEKCDSIPDDDEAATRAHLPIEHLAEIGMLLKRSGMWIGSCAGYPKRSPRDSTNGRTRRKICLDAGDLPKMERYLAIAEAGPNVHFPVMSICNSLKFLVSKARRMLQSNGCSAAQNAHLARN